MKERPCLLSHLCVGGGLVYGAELLALLLNTTLSLIASVSWSWHWLCSVNECFNRSFSGCIFPDSVPPCIRVQRPHRRERRCWLVSTVALTTSRWYVCGQALWSGPSKHVTLHSELTDVNKQQKVKVTSKMTNNVATGPGGYTYLLFIMVHILLVLLGQGVFVVFVTRFLLDNKKSNYFWQTGSLS